jgi:uncharacterized membrane protein YfcA
MTTLLLDDPAAWLACSIAMFAAVLTQRATGGAFGMVVAPFVALTAPAYMPGGVLIASLLVTVLCLRLPLGAIDWRELMPMLLGRGAGALGAAVLVVLAPDPAAVAVFVAVSVIAGVGLSLAGLRAALTPRNLLAAGALSGLTGTLTSVGAPPVMLLYQHRAAAEARPTLNAFFMLGVALSLAALALGGRLGWTDLSFVLAMLPALALGFALAPAMLRWLGTRSLRPLVLGLATFASVLILFRWVPALIGGSSGAV